MKRRILWLGVFGLTIAAATGITVWSISPRTKPAPERFSALHPAGTPVAFNPMTGQPPAQNALAPQPSGSYPASAYPTPNSYPTPSAPYPPNATTVYPNLSYASGQNTTVNSAYASPVGTALPAQAPAPRKAIAPGQPIAPGQQGAVHGLVPHPPAMASTLPSLPSPVALPGQYIAPAYAPGYPAPLPTMTAPVSPAYIQNEQQIHGLVASYAATKAEEEREQLVKKITELVTNQFDERQKGYDSELKEMEKQLKALRDKHDKREAARKDIIGDRVMQLINQADGLGWTENGANAPTRTHTIYYPGPNGPTTFPPQWSPVAPLQPPYGLGQPTILPLTQPAGVAPALTATPPTGPAAASPRRVYSTTVPTYGAPGVLVEERVTYDFEPAPAPNNEGATPVAPAPATPATPVEPASLDTRPNPPSVAPLPETPVAPVPELPASEPAGELPDGSLPSEV